MPIGEFIGEVLFRGIIEIILYALAYYTGAGALWILTLGQLRIAPLTSIDKTNKGKNRWTDWSIWLHQGRQNRVLKAEIVCLVGLMLWIAVGIGLYFGLRGDRDNSEQGTEVRHGSAAGVLTRAVPAE